MSQEYLRYNPENRLLVTGGHWIDPLGNHRGSTLAILMPAARRKQLVRVQTKTQSDLHSQQTLHP